MQSNSKSTKYGISGQEAVGIKKQKKVNFQTEAEEVPQEAMPSLGHASQAERQSLKRSNEGKLAKGL